MASYLITGSSRGLGLELVRQLAALPSSRVSRVFATARNPSSAQLKEVMNESTGLIIFVRLDATDQSSIMNAVIQVAKEIGTSGLDVLINNAGVMPTSPDGIETM